MVRKDRPMPRLGLSEKILEECLQAKVGRRQVFSIISEVINTAIYSPETPLSESDRHFFQRTLAEMAFLKEH